MLRLPDLDLTVFSLEWDSDWESGGLGYHIWIWPRTHWTGSLESRSVQDLTTSPDCESLEARASRFWPWIGWAGRLNNGSLEAGTLRGYSVWIWSSIYWAGSLDIESPEARATTFVSGHELIGLGVQGLGV